MDPRRERPYAQFNYLVYLDPGTADSPHGGFQEISGLGRDVSVSDYRGGTEQDKSLHKITGLNKATDVTLKRGVIGAVRLHHWLNQIREGDPGAVRTVTIQLQSQDGTGVVQTWRLVRARIIKHTSGPLNAKGGTDVAVEELVLACDRLEQVTSGQDYS